MTELEEALRSLPRKACQDIARYLIMADYADLYESARCEKRVDDRFEAKQDPIGFIISYEATLTRMKNSPNPCQADHGDQGLVYLDRLLKEAMDMF